MRGKKTNVFSFKPSGKMFVQHFLRQTQEVSLALLMTPIVRQMF